MSRGTECLLYDVRSLLLLARLVRVRRVSNWENVSDALMRRSPSNFLLNGSSGSASMFRMGSQSAWWVVAQCQQRRNPLMPLFFSKEQFYAKLRFSFPFIFKQFLHFTKIPPIFLHLNAVKILMGCSILNMLYHLDLSLLEVLLVYTVKMS